MNLIGTCVGVKKPLVGVDTVGPITASKFYRKCGNYPGHWRDRMGNTVGITGEKCLTLAKYILILGEEGQRLGNFDEVLVYGIGQNKY